MKEFSDAVTDDLVTVLMPVRVQTATDSRLQQWFKQALQSLVEQSYSNLEILLIGDSDRRVERWLPRNISRLSNLQIVAREEPGLVAALNTGIKVASGNLIARMDADDIALPERISRQVQLLQQQPAVDFCATAVEIFGPPGGITDGSRRYQDWLNSQISSEAIQHSVFIESPMPHPSWMLRRQLFQQLGGYRRKQWAEDYDLVLRAWLAGSIMAKPQGGPLLRWREHELRLTRSDQLYSRHNFLRAKAWALSQSLLKQRNAIILGTGSNAKRLHDALRDNDVSVSCFVELNNAHHKTTLKKLPIINYDELATGNYRSDLIVSAVTRYGARCLIRQWFDTHKMIDGVDYIFAG